MLSKSGQRKKKKLNYLMGSISVQRRRKMPASVCLGGLLIIRSILYIPHHLRRQWTYKHILVSKTFGRKEGNVFILTAHSTHFIYGCMASDKW